MRRAARRRRRWPRQRRISRLTGLRRRLACSKKRRRWPRRSCDGFCSRQGRDADFMTAIRKILGASLLVLLTLNCGAMLLSAQDQAPPPKQQPAKSSEAQVERAPEKGGVGRQLAHETREAAGEEKDETAEFKQSASVQLVSKLTGLDLRRAYWLSVLTNFIVIAAVLVWAGRK